MSFNSDTNKALLWNLMYEGGVFTNIDNSNLSKVKELFDKKILSLSNTQGSVLDKNKQAMREMIKELETIRTKPTLNSNRKYDTPVTSSDIQNQRREVFNSNLEKRQNEFNDMIKAKTPNKPKFSDSPDEKPIGHEMDKLVSDMITKRKLEISNVTASHNANAAQEWITKDNKNPESFTNILNDNPSVMIKIGESIDSTNIDNIQLDVREEINKERKRVTFKTDNDDFLAKFKKTERENSEIIKDIKVLRDEITSKLSKIDDLLVELH